jgi:hypothetical protein
MRELQEERIEAALDGLRKARAPEGLEERVLAAVRVREAEIASRVGWESAWVWGGVAAAVAVMVVAGVMLGLRHGAAGAGTAQMPPATHAGPAAAVAPVPEKRAAVDEAARQVVAPVMRGRRHRAARVVRVSRTEGRRSYPAPLAPLTEEERVLLAIARSGRLEDLAMLDPVARARENARDDAEFEQFIQYNRNEVHP